MVATALLLVWTLIAPAALGVLLLRAIGLRWAADRLGFAAWTWPAGALVLGLSLFAYAALGVEPWLWASAPLFPAIALALAGARRRAGEPPVAPAAPAGRAVPVLAAAGALWCAFLCGAAAAIPVVEGDEGNIWSLKAKSLVVDLSGGDFAAAQVWNLHPDYPLLNPLLQAWVYAQAGEIVHFANRVPIQLFALSLWLSLCAALRRRGPPWLAVALLLPLLLSPRLAVLCRAAFADGMVALGLLLALDGWLRHRDSGRNAWLGLIAIGGAVALWSKNEALLYALVVAIAAALAVLLRRARLRAPPAPAAAALLLPLVVVAAQAVWNRHFGLRSDLFGANPGGGSLPDLLLAHGGERLPVVAGAALDLVTRMRSEFGVLLVVLASALLWPRAALGRRLFVPTLALLGSFAGLHLVYLGTHLEVVHHMRTSQDRVVFQLVPVALLWFLELVREVRTGPAP